MSPEEPKFGPFGSGGRPGGAAEMLRPLLSVILFLFAAGLPLYVFTRDDHWSLERDSPVIEMRRPPGIGREPLQLPVRITDPGAGLSKVSVRLIQGALAREIYAASPPHPEETLDLQLLLDAAVLELTEGTAELVINAWDASIWKNLRTFGAELRIDTTAPVVSIPIGGSTGTAGGSALLFFDVTEEGERFTGVRLGAELYPGFRGGDLEADFRPLEKLHFSLFPVPESGVRTVQVFARDAVGNYSVDSTGFTTAPAPGDGEPLRAPGKQMDAKLESLYKAFIASGPPDQVESPPCPGDSCRRELFRIVTEVHAGLVEQRIRPLFLRPKAERLWEGPFRWPAGSRGGFGAARWVTDGQLLGTLGEKIVMLHVEPSADVSAANAGVVIFAGDLGPYGNAVVIDHGLGLTSSYLHLAQGVVREGDRVEGGQVIASSGESGLALGSVLGFQMRLHGKPVLAAQWFDRKWVHENFDKKMNRIRRMYELPVLFPIDSN